MTEGCGTLRKGASQFVPSKEEVAAGGCLMRWWEACGAGRPHRGGRGFII